jgi:asparagine synthase (glutamine-hydrolysing)
MCGIAGVLSLAGGSPEREVLRGMAEAMRHRGPDDEGVFLDREVGLVFRRLSIIDLAGGHQPMTSHCGRFTIAFNGEIYNYRELRRELQERHGSRFLTNSDTETILEAYRAWGRGCLSRLNGMFAFALWDAGERRLLLARDRLGKKPLYFSPVPGGVAFASEIKALFRHPGVSANVERRRVPTFIAYRYLPGDETLFSGVRCLPAASTLGLTATGGVEEPVRYWDYDFDEDRAIRERCPALGERKERLLALLEDSVRLRMIADVPVGAFLSGGLDSSLVVALMSRIHPEPLKTFSVAFDTGFSEERYAQLVARRYATDHHTVRVGSRELIENIPRVLHARETPITEASDIPIFLLSEMARTKVTVVLSGEGGDETLAGYPKYAFERLLGGVLRRLPRRLLSAAARSLPFRLRRAQLALECIASEDKLEGYAGWFGGFAAADRAALLDPELAAGTDVHAFSREALSRGRFPTKVEEMLYLDTAHWLPANLLLRGDRMTMANSLELRCPFLDFRLVEHAAREVLRSDKLRGLNGKWLLREAARPFLPPEVLERRKWGFKVPTSQWFQGPLLEALRQVLLSDRAAARGYFRREQVRQLIDRHASGQVDNDKKLWILFQLELWHLMFVDRVLGPRDSLV